LKNSFFDDHPASRRDRGGRVAELSGGVRTFGETSAGSWSGGSPLPGFADCEPDAEWTSNLMTCFKLVLMTPDKV